MSVRPLCPCHGEPMYRDRSYSYGWRCAIPIHRKRARGLAVVAEEIAARGSCCLDCKEAYEDGVFDWHHRDPNGKEGNVLSIVGRPPDVIRAELAKCDLLCANCHRRRHKKMPRYSLLDADPLDEFESLFDQLSLEGIA